MRHPPSHLANFENTSNWNYQHAAVAESRPTSTTHRFRSCAREHGSIKYLMKYFEFKANQETLADVQRVAEDISRLEEAVANVQRREARSSR